MKTRSFDLISRCGKVVLCALTPKPPPSLPGILTYHLPLPPATPRRAAPAPANGAAPAEESPFIKVQPIDFGPLGTTRK